MKKLLAGLFDGLHMLTAAFLFTAAFWVSPLVNPVKHWKYSGIPADRAGRMHQEVQEILLDRGPWIAAIGVALVAGAGFLRGDGKRLLGMVRLGAAVATMLFALWSISDVDPRFLYRPWNCILVAAGLDLAVTGFLVGGGKGGSAGASKDSKEK